MKRAHHAERKDIIVTCVASGIGQETARQIIAAGGKIVGLDRNPPNHVHEGFHQVDLMVEAAVDAVVAVLKPLQAHGLANIAGVPHTALP